MNFKLVTLIGAAMASAVALSGSAQADSLSITYFAIANSGQNNGTGDFGICCSSPPATSPDVQLGSPLGPDGLPIAGPASNVQDLVPSTSGNEIAWWGPLAAQFGIHFTGLGNSILPYSSNMYYVDSTGANDAGHYETAVLSGSFTGIAGADTIISVTSDDDALVYINGVFVGGDQGVTCCGATTIDLGDINGATKSLEIFYADRARVGAYLTVSVDGATTNPTPNTLGMPEPLTLSILGAGLIGAAGMRRRRRRKAA